MNKIISFYQFKKMSNLEISRVQLHSWLYKNKITGKNLTPFLLKIISQESGGACLKANISLALNNVLLGAKIALGLISNK